MMSETGLLGVNRRAFLTSGAAVLCFEAKPVLSAKTRIPLRLAVAAGATPFSWQEWGDGSDGRIRGIIPEVLTRICDHEGLHKATFTGFPWARAQRMVEEGLMDGFCTNATEERRRYAIFGREPVVVSEFAIFASGTDPRIDDMRQIVSVNDLKQYRVADYIGNGIGESLFAGFHDQILWQRGVETVFRLIANGRADLTYANEMLGRYVLAQMGLISRFVVLPIRLSPPSVYRLGLRNDYPSGKEFLERLDVILGELRRAGTLDKIASYQF